MTSAWLQAVLLGVVQGLTEFIPVSSSGHLVLVPAIAGWQKPELAFDVALHAGTMAAIVVYFFGDLVAMAKGLLGLDRTPEGQLARRLAWLLALASVPVAVVGLLLREVFEEAFTQPAVASGFLLVTAALLVTGERVRTRRVAASAPVSATVAEHGAPERRLAPGWDAADPRGLTLLQVGVRQAVIVGLFQMLALLPGVSRAGSTITGGMLAGLTRESATRFSFLLALPALLGAFAISVGDLADPGMFSYGDIALGVLAAAISGYAAIRFLIRLVARDRLTPFAVYCVAVGILGLVFSLVIA